MEALMRKIAGLALAVATLVAGLYVSTFSSALASDDNRVPTMSGYEVHLRANVKDLPAQGVEDPI
jgi:hypothetical protein